MRSKPDPLDQPERTAHYRPIMVQCALLKCYAILCYSTETVLLIFPFPPDQHHCSDKANTINGNTRNLWRTLQAYLARNAAMRPVLILPTTAAFFQDKLMWSERPLPLPLYDVPFKATLSL